jgi:hypothetical protein
MLAAAAHSHARRSLCSLIPGSLRSDRHFLFDALQNLTQNRFVLWLLEQMPDGLWKGEDKDDSGFIEWAEFSGPKGDDPALEKKDEL